MTALKQLRHPLIELFPENVILAGYCGSIAHGTYVPSPKGGIDDKDLMGVFVGPLEHYIGFGRKDSRVVAKDEWDVVSYEVRKYISLLAKSNPNVLSLLWLEPKYYVHMTEYGERLIQARDKFITKKAYHSFTGYAYSQLKKMKGVGKNAGAKRKELVAKFGIDTKNASHLIRLLKMGIELLTEGRIFVERPDAPMLIDIKMGRYSLEHIEQLSDDLMQDAREAYLRSSLPSESDKEWVEQLTMDIIRDVYFR